MSRMLSLVVLSSLMLLTSCAQYENQRGVDVTWQPESLTQFSKGSTTRRQVMDRLGPPSQIIALDDETVLYYLYERSAGNGLILVVYNRFQVDTRYDRAVFFFDDNDVLSDYASYIHADDPA